MLAVPWKFMVEIGGQTSSEVPDELCKRSFYAARVLVCTVAGCGLHYIVALRLKLLISIRPNMSSEGLGNALNQSNLEHSKI